MEQARRTKKIIITIEDTENYNSGTADSMCVDQGSYMVNFLKCCQCGLQDLKIGNRSCTDLEDEEIITYQHICVGCEHIIAEHEHTFKVEGEFQVYEMSCMLCGSAEDQRSIMPVDPRGPVM